MQNRIREIRELKGWTLAQLAEKIGGTNADQMSKLERGERGLNLNWMNKIAAALQVDPSELLPSNKVSEPPATEYSTHNTYSEKTPTKSARVKIPLYKGKLAAGPGVCNDDDDEVIDGLTFKRDWLAANIKAPVSCAIHFFRRTSRCD